MTKMIIISLSRRGDEENEEGRDDVSWPLGLG
jgi:hypothetical protein